MVSRLLFSDVDGVLKRANATEYGLASGVFTNDISKVSSLASLQKGWIFVVNCCLAGHLSVSIRDV